MVVYPASHWTLEGFRPATRGGKKVIALLRNKKTNKINELPFGQKGSSTYHDLTRVGGDPVHHDKKKRENYRKRHKGEGDQHKKWSAGFLAYHWLW